MEIGVQPRGFNVVPVKIPTAEGLVDGMRFTIIDQTGIAVHATFGADDWRSFQAYVADPEGESAKATARAKIVAPGGRAPSIRKH